MNKISKRKVKLLIYNTQTRRKEEFISLSPQKVKMYVCGPTVYGLLHVGNFRGPVFFHLVYHWFVYNGYQVTYVFNFTDIDDKIIQRALEEKVSTSFLTQKYINAFKEDYKSLKLKPPTHTPKVSDFINEIIEFISSLINKKKAYSRNGNVYFSVQSFKNYGRLSHRTVESLVESENVQEKESKNHPSDFALWKKSKSNEPAWDSPWGKGRPGWHIECSTMASSFLGETIDIHGGGIDLVFPHHENEKAQSEALTEKPFVRYWMHNNMLEFKSQKMSKSLGNIQTYREFLKNYNAEIFKFVILSVHYRSVLDFSPSHLDGSLLPLARIYSSLARAKKEMNFAYEFFNLKEKDSIRKFDFSKSLHSVKEKTFLDQLKEKSLAVEKNLSDDINTPEVMARIFEVVKLYNTHMNAHINRHTGSLSKKAESKTPSGKKEEKMIFSRYKISLSFNQWIRKWGQLMSLFQESPIEFLTDMDNFLLRRKGLKREEIQEKVIQRVKARREKNYQLSDQIRDELAEKGISLQDLENGETEWEVSKGI